jgi:hypothetical protein
MKVEATVVDISVKMGERRSKLDPNAVTTVPVWQVVATHAGNDTTIQLGLSTMNAAVGEKYHIGQQVEIEIWPKNVKAVPVQLSMITGDEVDPDA